MSCNLSAPGDLFEMSEVLRSSLTCWFRRLHGLWTVAPPLIDGPEVTTRMRSRLEEGLMLPSRGLQNRA